MVIQAGQTWQFKEDHNCKIFILEPTVRDATIWSIFDHFIGVMYNLEEDYLKEQFEFVRDGSVEELAFMLKKCNPTLDDLRYVSNTDAALEKFVDVQG